MGGLLSLCAGVYHRWGQVFYTKSMGTVCGCIYVYIIDMSLACPKTLDMGGLLSLCAGVYHRWGQVFYTKSMGTVCGCIYVYIIDMSLACPKCA